MTDKPTQSLLEPTVPVPSLLAFAGNLIDYAGLLTPVSLPLDKAFNNYMSYRDSEFKWMLSNFVCLIDILPELTSLLNNKFKDEDGNPLLNGRDIGSIVYSGGTPEAKIGLIADLQKIYRRLKVKTGIRCLRELIL